MAGKWGLWFRHQEWRLAQHSLCADGQGSVITTAITGTTNWIVSQALTTSGGQYWLEYLYLARQRGRGRC